MSRCCDETLRCDIGAVCRGWIAEGHPWHGCDLPPDHQPRGAGRPVVHRCPCGHTWEVKQKR